MYYSLCSYQHLDIAQWHSQTVESPAPRTSVPLQLTMAKKPLMHNLLCALSNLAHATTLTSAYKTLSLLIEGAQSFTCADSSFKLWERAFVPTYRWRSQRPRCRSKETERESQSSPLTGQHVSVESEIEETRSRAVSTSLGCLLVLGLTAKLPGSTFNLNSK